jgi:hypothetical protein
MDDNPYVSPKTRPAEAAQTSGGFVKFCVGCAFTFGLGAVGAILGMLTLPSLLIPLIGPSEPRPDGEWVIVPHFLSIVLGGLAGFAIGLFLARRYEVYHRSAQGNPEAEPRQ